MLWKVSGGIPDFGLGDRRCVRKCQAFLFAGKCWDSDEVRPLSNDISLQFRSFILYYIHSNSLGSGRSPSFLKYLVGCRPKFSKKGQLNMEMDYFAFVEEIRRKIIAETGFAEDKVYFEQKGGTFARTGDRLFVECASNEDSREVCGIYIEELYDRYLEGKSIDGMAQDVVGEIRRVKREGYFENTRKLVSYETAKDSLFIRLINFDRNKTDLKNAVYRTLGDIALVLYMKIGEEGGCMTSVKIRKEYMKKWEIPENEVFSQGIWNTYQMTPPRIFRWERLVFDEEYMGDEFMETAEPYELRKDAMGNCLSTAVRTNGAAAIFMPGVAKKLGELMG